jgi:hypothetical protein
MIKYYLGIDPGKDGAFAVLDENYKIVEVFVMPTIGDKRVYDKQGIREILFKYPYEYIVIEKPTNLYGYAKSAVESLSHCIGLLEGMVFVMGAAHTMIKPTQWQVKAWGDTPRQYKAKNEAGRKMSDPKATTLLACINYYPTFEFRQMGKRGKPLKHRHDGVMDATLLCRYGIQTY